MAILRMDEVRGMSQEELMEKYDDLKLDLAKDNGKIEIGSFPENAGKIKEIKRAIARIKTYQNQENKEGE